MSERTTQTGIPIRECSKCGYTHAITRDHCLCCGRPSAFLDPDGICIPCSKTPARLRRKARL